MGEKEEWKCSCPSPEAAGAGFCQEPNPAFRKAAADTQAGKC